MSKNIDEIVGSVLPKNSVCKCVATLIAPSPECSCGSFERHLVINECGESLKQALTDKKLVVPLTLTKLGEIFNEVRHDNLTDFQISQVIYEAQFKGVV